MIEVLIAFVLAFLILVVGIAIGKRLGKFSFHIKKKKKQEIGDWKRVQDGLPEMHEYYDYSEDIVFVTKDGELHTGFYSHTFWFDVDEEYKYPTEEVEKWIYLKDFYFYDYSCC